VGIEMSNEVVEFKELTVEQKLAFKKLGRKYLFKFFLTGVHSILVTTLMLIILNLAVATYAENSIAIPFFGGVLIGVLFFRNLRSTMEKHRATLSQEVKAIIEN
jgi:hypothetical protein